MKRISTLLFFSLFAYAGFAQTSVPKKDVPQPVINSYLSQNSAGATDSVWMKENITIYKVQYMDAGQRYEAHYFGDGRWIKTYTEIDQVALPVTVTKRISELYPGHKISKAYIELNNDGKFYAADLYKGNDKLTCYFTMSGKFVK